MRTLAIVAVVAFVLFLWGPDVVTKAVDLTADLLDQSERLTDAPASSSGVVPETPAELAEEAAVTLGRFVSVDAYALARMIRSEDGRGSPRRKIAIAWVAVNAARARRVGLLQLLTTNDRRAPFKFGIQRGGWCSTAQDPYEVDLKVAERVLDGELADPTGGAIRFVHRDAFGVQEGTGSYASVVERWGAEGLRPVDLGDVGDLVVFRRVGAVS
jgi:hypothetical protein